MKKATDYQKEMWKLHKNAEFEHQVWSNAAIYAKEDAHKKAWIGFSGAVVVGGLAPFVKPKWPFVFSALGSGLFGAHALCFQKTTEYTKIKKEWRDFAEETKNHLMVSLTAQHQEKIRQEEEENQKEIELLKSQGFSGAVYFLTSKNTTETSTLNAMQKKYFMSCNDIKSEHVEKGKKDAAFYFEMQKSYFFGGWKKVFEEAGTAAPFE